jgi:ABC-type microcin C transport system permease subunit YejB
VLLIPRAGVFGTVRKGLATERRHRPLRQDWVRTLRSRGLPERRVLFKHVLPNAGGPALSVLALAFVGLLGGTVIVEEVFAIPAWARSRSRRPPTATSPWSWAWW